MSTACRILALWIVVASPAFGQESGVVEAPPPLTALPQELALESPVLESMTAASFEDRVMELVNEERWVNGQLPPLKKDALLDAAAELHSQNMAARNFFAHCDPDTKTLPWDRMVNAGYFWLTAGENIAAGSSTPERVVDLWMGSSGHRANILSTSFRELGIGYALDGSDGANVRRDSNGDCVSDSTSGPWIHYWTQNFGSRGSVYPVVIDREAFETASRNVALYLYGSGWAQEMRLRNETGLWTPWMTFTPNVAWQLSDGDGTKIVNVELRNGSIVRTASDTIELTGQGPANGIFADGFESGNLSSWSQSIP